MLPRLRLLLEGEMRARGQARLVVVSNGEGSARRREFSGSGYTAPQFDGSAAG